MRVRGFAICTALVCALLLALFLLMAVGYMPWDGHGKPSHERVFCLMFGLAEGISLALLILLFERDYFAAASNAPTTATAAPSSKNRPSAEGGQEHAG
jgi:hypothetical protein